MLVCKEYRGEDTSRGTVAGPNETCHCTKSAYQKQKGELPTFNSSLTCVRLAEAKKQPVTG